VSDSAPDTLPWPIQCVSELLDDVAREMHKAAKDPDADAIHDVRVAIRRLRQCLDVFAPMFPARRSAKIDRKARKVLKAAGEVRNFDIAAELIKKARITRARPLIEALHKDRGKAEKDLARALAKVDDGAVVTKKWVSKLTAGHGVDGAFEQARRSLPRLVTEFFDAGDAASRPAADAETMHKFRIQTKKLRYTLELFERVLGYELVTRMEALRGIQQRLGDINDYVASGKVLAEYRDSHAETVDRTLGRLARMTATETTSFRRYWKKSFGPKQKEAWIKYVSGNSPASGGGE